MLLLSVADFFSKLTFFSKISFRDIISVSNGLDPYLGPNCLQRLVIASKQGVNDNLCSDFFTNSFL